MTSLVDLPSPHGHEKRRTEGTKVRKPQDTLGKEYKGNIGNMPIHVPFVLQKSNKTSLDYIGLIKILEKQFPDVFHTPSWPKLNWMSL